jgi:hypothetical protein
MVSAENTKLTAESVYICQRFLKILTALGTLTRELL